MTGELERFFREYFQMENKLGAVCDQSQLFRMLNSGNQVLIDGYYAREETRKIGILRENSMFQNPQPADLAKLVLEVYSPDAKVEIVPDQSDVRKCKYQLEEWCKKGDLRKDVKLTLEYQPTIVGNADFEKQLDSILSEAEAIRKEFPSSDFRCPYSYTLNVDGEPFIKFKRLLTHFGVILEVESVEFRGNNKEIVKLAETVDKIAEECYSRRR